MRGAVVTVTRQGRPIAERRPLRQGTDTAGLRDTSVHIALGLVDASELPGERHPPLDFDAD